MEDFPAPFGPRKPKASPRYRSKSIPSTAVKLPNRFVRPRARTSTSGTRRENTRRRDGFRTVFRLGRRAASGARQGKSRGRPARGRWRDARHRREELSQLSLIRDTYIRFQVLVHEVAQVRRRGRDWLRRPARRAERAVLRARGRRDDLGRHRRTPSPPSSRSSATGTGRSSTARARACGHETMLFVAAERGRHRDPGRHRRLRRTTGWATSDRLSYNIATIIGIGIGDDVPAVHATASSCSTTRRPRRPPRSSWSLSRPGADVWLAASSPPGRAARCRAASAQRAARLRPGEVADRDHARR